MDGKSSSQVVQTITVLSSESQSIFFKGKKTPTVYTLGHSVQMKVWIGRLKKNHSQIFGFSIWSDTECKQSKDYLYT